MGWLYGIGAFIIVIVWLANNPLFGVPVLLAALGAATYGIYLLVLNSAWLRQWEREQVWKKKEAEARALAAEWDNITLPPFLQFLKDIEVPTELDIVEEAQIIIATVYEPTIFKKDKLRPAEALALYQQLVDASKKALEDYAKKLPALLKETALTRHRLTIRNTKRPNKN
jgi:hypothetical protein